MELITIKRALNVYFITGIDVFNVDELATIDADKLEAICSLLRVDPSELATILRLSFTGHIKATEEQGTSKASKSSIKISLVKILELLGYSGLSSFDLTPFELLHYIGGMQKREWETTSAILATIHNSHITKKAHIKKPSDFNPTIEAKPDKSLDSVLFGASK